MRYCLLDIKGEADIMIINPALLSDFVEAKLNANSLNEFFKTYYYVEEVARRFAVDNTSNKSCIITYITDTNGQYRPIPDVDISDQNFILNVFYPLEKQGNIEVCLDELVQSLVGKTHTITSDRVSMSTVWSADTPIFASVQKQALQELCNNDSRISFDETKIYGLLRIRLYFASAPTRFKFGNETTYYIGKVLQETGEVRRTDFGLVLYQGIAITSPVKSINADWYTTAIMVRGTNPTTQGVIAGSVKLGNSVICNIVSFYNGTTRRYYWGVGDYEYFDFANETIPARSGIVFAASENAPSDLEVFLPHDFRVESLCKAQSETAKATLVQSEQPLGYGSAENIVSANTIVNSLTVYADDNEILEAIVDNAENGTNQNKVYWLVKTRGEKEWWREVIIDSARYNETLGNIDTVTLTFKKASDIL